ncbi:hypothetical protein ACKWB9_04255 [Maribacter sp. 2304DJ31-5]
MMDGYLIENNIQNLFYTGFDTFYCILDKPNGIFSFSKRKKDLNIFLLEDGVHSFTEEMKMASIELLKKNGVGLIKSNQTVVSFEFPKKTLTNISVKTQKTIKPDNNFIVIFKRSSKHKELERFEYDLNVNGIDYAIAKNDKMYYKGNEVSSYDFVKLLRDKNIKNVYYSGFYLNNELLWSDYGMIAMYIKMRYAQVKGLPKLNVINDLAFIAPSETLEPKIEKATIINHYREIGNIMGSTLLEDIKKAKPISKPVAIPAKK